MSATGGPPDHSCRPKVVSAAGVEPTRLDTSWWRLGRARSETVPILECLDASPSSQQSLLEHVVRVCEGSSQPVAVEMQLTTMGPHQRFERLRIPDPCCFHQFGLSCVVRLGLCHDHPIQPRSGPSALHMP
jgi:hypothetical protein